MNPLTVTERSQSRRKKQKEKGLKELRNLWIRPEHAQKIREFAASLDRIGDK